MLEQRGISEDEAIKYIESSIPYKRTWKMWRFTLYLWMRVYYDKKGITKNRIDVVKEMVNLDLKKLTNDAFDKEVFGAPTFIVNNKIFWGQDRLDYAIEELS